VDPLDLVRAVFAEDREGFGVFDAFVCAEIERLRDQPLESGGLAH
jgi:hypothetical protein